MSTVAKNGAAEGNACLMVASIFTPIQGGSATVYANLCRFAPPGKMVALATRRYYHDGAEIAGWREHDERCGFPVHRLDLLRPEMAPPPANKLVSAWRFLTIDIPLRFRIVTTVHRLIRQHGIGVICIGELVSTAWLGEFCRRFFGTRMVLYVHGEEITQRGHDHRFELLDMRRESASPEVAAALDLAVGASVFHLHGVHFENELPVQIEDRYVNPRLVPDFMDQDFSAVQPSVYLVRNVQYDQIEHVVDAILPTAEQARLLQMALEQPCLMLTRRTWLRGVPITWVHCVHPGMRYRLGSRFRTDSVHGG